MANKRGKVPSGINMRDFIDKLRPRELTAAYLADISHISYSSIYKYNIGETTMPKYIVRKLIIILREESDKLKDYAHELEEKLI